MKGRIALLLLGFIFGLAVALLAPRFWQRWMPAGLRGEPTVGTVESKRWEEDRLLLTLVTDSGALLATFTERVAEIDLLVDVGDTVSLALRRYRPFVEDPVIDRVVKAAGEAEPLAPAAVEPPPVTEPAPGESPSPDTDVPPGGPEMPDAAVPEPPAASEGRVEGDSPPVTG